VSQCARKPVIIGAKERLDKVVREARLSPRHPVRVFGVTRQPPQHIDRRSRVARDAGKHKM